MLKDILSTLDEPGYASYEWLLDYPPELLTCRVWLALTHYLDPVTDAADDLVEVYAPDPIAVAQTREHAGAGTW
jgi:hypothetical protein